MAALTEDGCGMRCPPTNIDAWYEENKSLFFPPVCNKLLHKDQLTVMFVGGPNTRTDFHLEHGSEFFWMLRGNMELPTVQRGERKLVRIREGEVFLLPSRIPHSPQRPEEGSLGLVVERMRYEDELDGLRWYVDFETCEGGLLWERYFHCGDLGRDLVPVVKAFKASEACSKGVPTPGDGVVENPPLVQDTETAVPEPFNLQEWIEARRDQLAAGASLALFEDHPDGEFDVRILGGSSQQESCYDHETVLYQLEGEVSVAVDGSPPTTLGAGSCCVVGSGKKLVVVRPAGTVGMVVRNDPKGNKR